jgi:hypothetical protein
MYSKAIKSFVMLLIVIGTCTPASAQETAASVGTAPQGTTRLFFAPTARTLPAGTIYAGTMQVLMPFFEAGVTDRLTVGAGAPPQVLVGAPFWATARVQVADWRGLSAAVGLLNVSTLNKQFGGIAYAATTYGGASGSVTSAVGWLYSSDGLGPASVMVGGDRRLTTKARLVTENYLFRGGAIVSGGIRYGGERFSADIGIMRAVATEYPPFPVLNFVWRF